MTNKITYTVAMRIKDDEWADSDEYANRSASGILTLDEQTPERQILEIGRCGGEVRVEARYTFRRAGSGAVDIAADLKLYEGASDNSTDLDGRQSFIGAVLPHNLSLIHI